MRIVKRPGSLASSNEQGQGRLIHAVDRNYHVFDGFEPALCGERPRGKNGWTDYEYMKMPIPAVTCPKCLERLEALKTESGSTATGRD
ncbi:hypothetical protein SAMN05216409_118109 [Pseudomonas lutea]|uniref:Uncharacterized protein n=1 Tax=Pseudomonas lutea TaxID=243924 RepID=A0A9X8MH68_9PSED|nr:hypothetical protein SAMN05216409_118109 [Pseudomonas lutea]